MCLTIVHSEGKGTGTKVRVGYKIFRWNAQLAKSLRFEYGKLNMSNCVPQRRWITSEPCRLPARAVDFRVNKSYPSGFHIYKDKPSVAYLGYNKSLRRVVRVQYKGVLATGTQFGNEVIVAKHMKVPQQRRKP